MMEIQILFGLMGIAFGVAIDRHFRKPTVPSLTKPCPFCGGKRKQYPNYVMGQFFFACNKCNAIGPIAKTDEGAAQAWDTRHE